MTFAAGQSLADNDPDMTVADTIREFKPGTTGWTADDLDDPDIERLWESGAYEIVEGVLTIMPPAYLDSSLPMSRLVRVIDRHCDVSGIVADFATEVDLIVARKRVARPDSVYMTPIDLRRQQEANGTKGKPTLKYRRLRISPPLVIE